MFRRREARGAPPIAARIAPAAPPHENDPAQLIAAAVGHARRGEWDQAEPLAAHALALAPDRPDAHEALGNILLSRGAHERALLHFERALEQDPLRTSALSNLGLCLRNLGRIEEARSALEQAATRDPDNPTIATNLAAVLFDTGHFDEAHSIIETTLRKDPDFAEARVIRGTRLLRRGDFARGWADYEWRNHDATPDRQNDDRYPRWSGEPMADGILLVRAEQGLGDQIMFASCIDDALALAPHCVVECDVRLKALFARSFPRARIYAQRRNAAELWVRDGLDPSAMTWMGHLPGLFRRSAADFPQRQGYLQADVDAVSRWKDALRALGPGPKVGISWRGGTATTRSGLRSIPLEAWLPLLQSPGMHFVSLQYGDVRADIERVRALSGIAITDWERSIEDYDQTAALVGALDLVVSVQTAIVHLTGALGKAAFVLVPEIAEWRYGESGERMPWYPSVRLFRQRRAGDWADVMERSAHAVRDWVEGKARTVR